MLNWPKTHQQWSDKCYRWVCEHLQEVVSASGLSHWMSSLYKFIGFPAPFQMFRRLWNLYSVLQRVTVITLHMTAELTWALPVWLSDLGWSVFWVFVDFCGGGGTCAVSGLNLGGWLTGLMMCVCVCDEWWGERGSAATFLGFLRCGFSGCRSQRQWPPMSCQIKVCGR